MFGVNKSPKETGRTHQKNRKGAVQGMRAKLAEYFECHGSQGRNGGVDGQPCQMLFRVIKENEIEGKPTDLSFHFKVFN